MPTTPHPKIRILKNSVVMIEHAAMMGFEIAGAALGAPPVLISALEHYRDVTKLFSSWWEIHPEYQKCNNDTRYHHFRYKRNLKQLLLPLVVEDDKIARLIVEPSSNEWKDPDIAQQLGIRRQDSHELCPEIMQQMDGVIAELHKVLGFDKSGFQEGLKGDKVSTMS